MKEWLTSYLDVLVEIWLDMSPYLLLGMFIAFFCSYFLTEARTRRHLSDSGWFGIVKASLLGLPLPLCSCGVLPVGLSLRKCGASKSATAAFLAAAPQSGTDALPLTWAVLGSFFAIARIICSVATGLVCGFLVRIFSSDAKFSKKSSTIKDDCTAICACHHHSPEHEHHHAESHHHEYVSRKQRWLDAARYAFVHLPGEIAILLTVGMFAAALIQVGVADFHLGAESPKIISYLLALVIGIPIYACSLAIIPIAASLWVSGVSAGAVFILLVVAPTTHFASIMILWRELGAKVTGLMIFSVVCVAMTFAVLIDGPCGNYIPECPDLTVLHAEENSQGHSHDGELLHGTFLGEICAGIFLILMVNGYTRIHKRNHPVKI